MANRDGQSALMQSIAAVQVGQGGMFHGLLTKIG